MISQKTLPMITAHVSLVPYFTCMKNSTTSVALVTAMLNMIDIVHRAQIDRRHPPREPGAHHQREEDRVVDALRNDVMGVVLRHDERDAR